MWQYLILYLLVIGLTYYVENYIKKDDKKTFYILSGIIILIISLFAGLRGTTVGTDVVTYAKPLLDTANYKETFVDFFNAKYMHSRYEITNVSGNEFGYLAIVFIISKLSGSLSVLLFFTQLLTVVPVYLALCHYRDKCDMWFGMAAYLLLFYNASFNMMRQYIAMAFLLFGITYLTSHKYIKYFVMVLVAMLFHTTAIIGVLFFLIYLFCNSKKIKYQVPIIAGASIVALIVYAPLLKFLLSEGLFPSKYAYFVNGSLGFSISAFIWMIPFLIFELIVYKKANTKVPEYKFLVSTCVMATVFKQLQTVATFASRISDYFFFFVIIGLPICLKYEIPKVDKRVQVGVAATMLVVYWGLYYVYFGRNATIPYVTIWG